MKKTFDITVLEALCFLFACAMFILMLRGQGPVFWLFNQLYR